MSQVCCYVHRHSLGHWRIVHHIISHHLISFFHLFFTLSSCAGTHRQNIPLCVVQFFFTRHGECAKVVRNFAPFRFSSDLSGTCGTALTSLSLASQVKYVFLFRDHRVHHLDFVFVADCDVVGTLRCGSGPAAGAEES